MEEQSCCHSEMITFTTKPQKYAKIKIAFTNACTLFRQMLPWLLVGAAVGSLIYGLIPEKIIINIAGPHNPFAIPLAAIIGVSMYIWAESMLPISSVLLDKGMGIGAVMVLIIGGSGASIPEVSLLAAIFKRKLVIAFVLTVLSVAVTAGFLAESLCKQVGSLNITSLVDLIPIVIVFKRLKQHSAFHRRAYLLCYLIKLLALINWG